MTPYQSARLNNYSKFLHHVRHVRSQIQKLSTSVTPSEMASQGMDIWTSSSN